jgi:hypothetical protein
MRPLIVVGIANTDRTRDLTPTHADVKNPDGTVTAKPEVAVPSRLQG